MEVVVGVDETLFLSLFMPAVVHKRVVTPDDVATLYALISNPATLPAGTTSKGSVKTVRVINRGELITLVDPALVDQTRKIHKDIVFRDYAVASTPGDGADSRSGSGSESGSEDGTITVTVCIAMRRIESETMLYHQLLDEASAEETAALMSGQRERFRLFCELALRERKATPQNSEAHRQQSQRARTEVVQLVEDWTSDRAIPLPGYFLATVDEDDDTLLELFTEGEIIMNAQSLYARLANVANRRLLLRESLVAGAGDGIFVSTGAPGFMTHQLITGYDGMILEESLYMENAYRARFASRVIIIGDRDPVTGAPLVADRARGVASFMNDNVLLAELAKSPLMGHLTEEGVAAMLAQPEFHLGGQLANAELIKFDDAYNVGAKYRNARQRQQEHPLFVSTIDVRRRIVVARAKRPVMAEQEIYLNYGADYWLAVLRQRSADSEEETEKKRRKIMGCILSQ